MNKGAGRASLGRLYGFILVVGASLNMQPAAAQEDPNQAPIKIQIHGAIEEPIPTLITIHGALKEPPHMLNRWIGTVRDTSQTALSLIEIYWLIRNQRISK